MIQLAQLARGTNEAAILAALKRLEPNVNATGARYDLLAIPQDNNDRSYQLGLTERLPDFRYAVITNRSP